MANKDLTSLKVYGNDDPAGSVYKVSGGGAGGGLMLKMLYTDPDARTGYLAHMDGSDATWQEIHDAVMAGVYVSIIKAASFPGGTTATSVYTVESVTHIVNYAVFCSSDMTFVADTSTGRLTLDTTSEGST